MFSLSFLMAVLNGMAEAPKVHKDGLKEGEELVGKSQEERGLTPEDKASPVSILLFTWMDPMIWAGFRRPPLVVCVVLKLYY